MNGTIFPAYFEQMLAPTLSAGDKEVLFREWS
jgi:hypothetical protein